MIMEDTSAASMNGNSGSRRRELVRKRKMQNLLIELWNLEENGRFSLQVGNKEQFQSYCRTHFDFSALPTLVCDPLPPVNSQLPSTHSELP